MPISVCSAHYAHFPMNTPAPSSPSSLPSPPLPSPTRSSLHSRAPSIQQGVTSNLEAPRKRQSLSGRRAGKPSAHACPVLAGSVCQGARGPAAPSPDRGAERVAQPAARWLTDPAPKAPSLLGAQCLPASAVPHTDKLRAVLQYQILHSLSSPPCAWTWPKPHASRSTHGSEVRAGPAGPFSLQVAFGVLTVCWMGLCCNQNAPGTGNREAALAGALPAAPNVSKELRTTTSCSCTPGRARWGG